MHGIANAAVQKRLLTEPELTFIKAVIIAQAVKLAEKFQESFNHSGTPKEFSHVIVGGV